MTDLETEVKLALQQLTGAADSAFKKTAETMAKGALTELKKAAASKWPGSSYPKGFKKKWDEKALKWVLWAGSPGYKLAHLLENGHDVVSHGKATGKRTKARPHFSLAQAYLDKLDVESIYQEVLDRELS